MLTVDFNEDRNGDDDDDNDDTDDNYEDDDDGYDDVQQPTPCVNPT